MKRSLVYLLCALTGCSFIETQSIKDKVNEIFQSTPPSNIEVIVDELPIYEKSLEEFKEDSGAVTIYYNSQSTSPDQLKKILEEQIQEIKISTIPENNQIIIRDESGSNIQKVKNILERTDKKPPQIMLEAKIMSVYGDFTQDFETTLKLNSPSNININSTFPGASLRAEGRSDMGFKIGYANAYWEATMDMLRSYGFAKDIATPNLFVSNRKRAIIQQIEKFPIKEEVITNGTVVTTTTYIEIPTSLEIIPYVLAKGYVGLNLKMAIGSRSTPQGPVQVPIIDQKEVEIDDLILKTGQTLIIAGLTTSTEMAVTREIPVPLLRYIFRGKDYEKRKRQIIFQITPNIIDTLKMKY